MQQNQSDHILNSTRQQRIRSVMLILANANYWLPLEPQKAVCYIV